MKPEQIQSLKQMIGDLLKDDAHTEAIPLTEVLVAAQSSDPHAWHLYAHAHSRTDLEKTAHGLRQILVLRPDAENTRKRLAHVESKLARFRPPIPEAVPAAAAEIVIEAPPPVTEPESLAIPIDPAHETAEHVAVTTMELPSIRETQPEPADVFPDRPLPQSAGQASFLQEARVTEMDRAQPPVLEEYPDPVSSDPMPSDGSEPEASGPGRPAHVYFDSMFTGALAAVGAIAYGMATVAVFEVIIGVVIFILQLIGDIIGSGFRVDTIIFGVIAFFLALVVGVVIGVITAVITGIGGLLGGIVIALANIFVAIFAHFTAPRLAFLLMPLTGGTVGVLIYHHFGYSMALDAAILYNVDFLAGLTYIVVFVVAAIGSVMMADMTLTPPADLHHDEEAEQATKEEALIRSAYPDNPELAEMAVQQARRRRQESDEFSNMLAGPWRLYGNIAKGSMKVGSAGLVASADMSSSWFESDEAIDQRFRNRRIIREAAPGLSGNDVYRIERQLNPQGEKVVVRKR